MCTVSMIGDHYAQKWAPTNIPNQQWPWQQDQAGGAGGIASGVFSGPSRLEFDQLKREVLEMKEFLRRAKEYDEKTGQAHCEQEEKLALLRRVAQAVGVDLDEVLGKSKP